MEPAERLKAASERYAEAKADRDKAIREASAAGMSRRAVAEIVGLSYTRVQQIVSSS